ncbi:hypothetical protein CAURIC_00370 [Corynebacterium auriscanis]|nr:hypothetical protein CAURIC_00370 [Corynebacterium auriscanis]
MTTWEKPSRALYALIWSDAVFKAGGPNWLGVVDITSVRTTDGFVDGWFVTDESCYTIVGRALPDTMRTEALPLETLNQALVLAR